MAVQELVEAALERCTAQIDSVQAHVDDQPDSKFVLLGDLARLEGERHAYRQVLGWLDTKETS
jgi:hypothetical protein